MLLLRNLLVISCVFQLSVMHVNGRTLLNLEDYTSEHANKVKNTLIFNSFVLCQVNFNLL